MSEYIVGLGFMIDPRGRIWYRLSPVMKAIRGVEYECLGVDHA